MQQQRLAIVRKVTMRVDNQIVVIVIIHVRRVQLGLLHLVQVVMQLLLGLL
jgi:hypothetical protein